MSDLRQPVIAFLLATGSVALVAQDNSHPEFEVVSIKRVTELRQGGGGRTLPDGTIVMMNRPVATFIQPASPVPVVDVVGLPDWTKTERYDVTMKPPAGSTREQIAEMWRTMFAERMHLVTHVDQQQRDVYSLIVARSDGRLGPDLKPSTLDCTPRPIAPSTPPPAPTAKEWQNRCGMLMSAGLIVSGGMAIDQFVQSLGGLAGGTVENHTGLQGPYALTLRFSPGRQLGASDVPTTDDAPDFFTALQEQLGLKLQRERKLMPVLVIDHIERPSEN